MDTLEYNLSFSQRSDLMEKNCLFKMISTSEQVHLQASIVYSQVWVNLSWEISYLEPEKWLISPKRQFLPDVWPVKKHCSCCRYQKKCKKWNCALTCYGTYCTSFRHRLVRDLLGRTYRLSGFELVFEHSGDLKDGSRPCNTIEKRRTIGKSLLIDFAKISPTVDSQ